LLNVRDVDAVNVMNVDDVNRALLSGELSLPGLFPGLETLESSPAVFRVEFGLDRLPTEPGVILIRGARQSGKSAEPLSRNAEQTRIYRGVLITKACLASRSKPSAS
jgi:hypothetical protein